VKYWINTISRDHVERGVQGGFTQANHGKSTNLKRLKKGDWMVFYSPRTSNEDGQILRNFTAIGQVQDEEPYQIQMMPGFRPWRRNIEFIKDKVHWGYMFRLGLFEVPESDFEIIKNVMIEA
jgi:hypothetical protein